MFVEVKWCRIFNQLFHREFYHSTLLHNWENCLFIGLKKCSSQLECHSQRQWHASLHFQLLLIHKSPMNPNDLLCRLKEREMCARSIDNIGKLSYWHHIWGFVCILRNLISPRVILKHLLWGCDTSSTNDFINNASTNIVMQCAFGIFMGFTPKWKLHFAAPMWFLLY